MNIDSITRDEGRGTRDGDFSSFNLRPSSFGKALSFSASGFWLLVSFLILIPLASPAGATDFTWDGGGNGTSWSDADNWDVGAGFPDDNGDKAIFPSGAFSTSITTGAARTIGELDIQSGFSGTITLGGDLTIDDAGVHNGNFTMADGDFDTDSVNDYALNVDGAFALNQTDGADDFIANGSSITVDGNVTVGSTAGIADFGTSTVTLTATGNISNPALTNDFYNVTQSGAITTTLTGNTRISNTLTTSATGTIQDNGTSVQIHMVNDGASLVINAGTTWGDGGGSLLIDYQGASFPGDDYGNTRIRFRRETSNTTLTGNITDCQQLQIGSTVSGSTTLFDTNGFNITCGQIIVGNSQDHYATANFDASTITQDNASGNLIIRDTDGGGNATLNAESSTIVIYGDFTVETAGTNGVFNAGTSTLRFDRVSGSAVNTLTSGGNSFYDVELVENGGTTNIQLQDALNIDNNLTITNGTLDANDLTITIAGNWSNSDTFTAGSGTVTFDGNLGTSTITSGGSAFNNFVVDDGDDGGELTAQLAGTLDVNGNLTITDGTLDANGQDITVEGNFTATDTFTPGTGKVTFDADADGDVTITSNGNSFNNVEFNHTGTTASSDDYILGDAMDVNGDVTVTDGTLHIAQNMNVAGSWTTAAAADITGSAKDLTFDASSTSETITSNGISFGTDSAFLFLVFDDGGGGATWELQDALNVRGNLTITGGTLDANAAGPFNITVLASWINNDTFLSQGNTVTFASLSVSGMNTGGTGTGQDFDNVTVNGTVRVNTNDVDIGGNLTINGSATFDLQGQNLTVDGTFSNLGTLELEGSETTTLTQDIDSGTWRYVGDGGGGTTAYTINNFDTSGEDYFNLTINSVEGTAETFSLGNTLEVAGNFTLTDGTFDTDSANDYAVTVDGTVDPDGGVMNLNDSAVSVGGAWTNTGTTVNPGTSATTFNASSGSLTVSSNSQSFYDIVFNDGGGTATWTLEDAMDVSHDFTLTDGNFDTKSSENNSLTVDNDWTISGGDFIANDSTVTVSRNVSVSGTFTRGTSEVVLAGNGNISGGTGANRYYDLTQNDGVTTTVTGNLRVNNIFASGNSTSTIQDDNTGSQRTIQIDDTIVNNGATWDSRNSLQIQVFSTSFGAGDYGDVEIRFAAGGSTVTLSGNVTTAGNFLLDPSGAGTTVTVDTNGVDLNVGSLEIGHASGSDYGNLTADASTVTVTGDVTIRDSDASGTNTLTGESASILVGGDWTIESADTTTGVFTPGSSTVTFNSSAAAQSVTMAGSDFNDLIVTNSHPSGVTFADQFDMANLTNQTAGSVMTFNATDTYAVSGTMTVDSGDDGNEITVQSNSGGSAFTFNVSGAAQHLFHVNVTDSEASGNDINCHSCTNGGGTDAGTGSPQWVFSPLRGSVMTIN